MADFTETVSSMKRVMGKMKENQEDERRRRGKRVELAAPELIRLHHRMSKQAIDMCVKSSSNAGLSVMKNTLDVKIRASKTAFAQLKRTTIPELRLEETASGEYLLARVLEDWSASMVAWNTVIEDHRGHVIRLALYNYPPDEIFSPGDVVILKEPYLRLPVDNNPQIRCDCPTDVIVLRPAHPLHRLAKSVRWVNAVDANDPLTAKPIPTNATQWKERGNRFFDRDQPILAREAYRLALAACSEDDPARKIVQLNLLAVQLRLERFEWVVENAEKLLKKYPDEKKAIFRLGKAHYGLRNYGKALEAYREFCEKFPEEKDGRTEMERARERVDETNGKFDFEKLRKTSAKKPLEEMDCADYCGPVKVVKIPGKGRGLVVTADVAKGAVLVVSKALAAVLDPLKTAGFQVDSQSRFETSRDRAENAAKVSRLIMKNPSAFGPPVYDLHSGIDNSSQQQQQAQLFCDPDRKQEPIADVELIKNISRCNSFSTTEVVGHKVRVKGGGLFLLPSYMNHSCVPNANAYEFYNDVMVVRAAKDMKKGTEVTITYVSLTLSFDERTRLLANRGFKCRCSRCKKRM